MRRFFSSEKVKLIVGYILCAVLFIGLSVSASTTISTSITTGGDLTVTGTTLLTGNVGIATGTPGAKLSVGGDILGNVIYGANFIATSSTASIFTGNLGIGTTTPFTKLGITGTTTSSAGMIVGLNGSPVNQVRFGTCTFNPGVPITTSVAVVSCTSATGVTPTDKVFVSPVGLPSGLVFVGASSTVADAISVAVFNATTTGGITPSSQVWNWMAIK